MSRRTVLRLQQIVLAVLLTLCLVLSILLGVSVHRGTQYRESIERRIVFHTKWMLVNGDAMLEHAKDGEKEKYLQAATAFEGNQQSLCALIYALSADPMADTPDAQRFLLAYLWRGRRLSDPYALSTPMEEDADWLLFETYQAFLLSNIPEEKRHAGNMGIDTFADAKRIVEAVQANPETATMLALEDAQRANESGDAVSSASTIILN